MHGLANNFYGLDMVWQITHGLVNKARFRIINMCLLYKPWFAK